MVHWINDLRIRELTTREVLEMQKKMIRRTLLQANAASRAPCFEVTHEVRLD